LSGKDAWNDYCDKIQDRAWKAVPKDGIEIENSKILRAEIFKCLTQARDERVLRTEHNKIRNLLKLEKSIQRGAGMYEISGGQRNFDRLRELPHFERVDGCWFDFAIFIHEQSKRNAEIIGFNFEIRFPEKMPVKYLRFDLNPPGHNNDDLGIRFHVHPGSDDLMVHSPPMSPLEILHLFLYGLPIPDKPRS
jgi:hypothetical protein